MRAALECAHTSKLILIHALVADSRRATPGSRSAAARRSDPADDAGGIDSREAAGDRAGAADGASDGADWANPARLPSDDRPVPAAGQPSAAESGRGTGRRPPDADFSTAPKQAVCLPD